MLGNAKEDNQFGHDSYFTIKKVKSLLCVAIKHQEELIGLLYVENNLAYHAFSQTRATVLTILASQMAISLENARLIEEKLEALNKITEEQRHRAEEAEKYQNDLKLYIAIFSHEMRNPLNIVLANCELMAMILNSRTTQLNDEKINQETAKNYKELIECNKLVFAAASLQLRIANDVLALEELSDGKVSLQTIPFSPKATIISCLEMYAADMSKKNISRKLEFNFTEDIMVIGDPDRLKQIINNILSNAIKFTEQNGAIYVKVIPKQSKEFTEFTITVNDNGRGMTEEEQTRIFKKFGQGNLRISPQYGGSGLGLSIAKNLIHLMHGNISVNSKQGEGSSFTFNIICNNLSDDLKKSLQNSVLEKKEKIETVSASKNVQTGARILIVDDNKANQLTIKRILELDNYQCELASDGKEAIAMCERSKFDLILMDIIMPIMGGLDATRVIRKNEIDNRIPIIGLSANATENDKYIAIEAGMDAYLTKPISREVLCEKVRIALLNYTQKFVPVKSSSSSNNLAKQSFKLEASTMKFQFSEPKNIHDKLTPTVASIPIPKQMIHLSPDSPVLSQTVSQATRRKSPLSSQSMDYEVEKGAEEVSQNAHKEEELKRARSKSP